MKKILNNKVYDTETAKLCGEYWNGCGMNDYNHLYENLYLKKTGEFFLHCQSGLLSKDSQSLPNEVEGRQIIIPLTYLEARQWAEDFLTAEEYEDIFGEIEEDDGWIPIHAYVKNSLVDKIEKEKQRSGLTLKDIVNAALEGYFNK